MMATVTGINKERDKKKGISELISVIEEIKQLEARLTTLSADFPEISAHTEQLTDCMSCLDGRIGIIMNDHAKTLTILKVMDDFVPDEKVVSSLESDLLRRRHTVPTNFKFRISGKVK